MLKGLRGEESIAAFCWREGIARSLCYSSSKELLEAGKKCLVGHTGGSNSTPSAQERLASLRRGRKTFTLVRYFCAVRARREKSKLLQKGSFVESAVLRISGGFSIRAEMLGDLVKIE